jgi:2'-hydroxyisoflavone reductase
MPHLGPVWWDGGMTRVLILGGTGWLSGRVARAWMDAGAAVTCVARGGRPAPEGAELIVADRAAPGAYDSVAEREWDEIVEISSIPEHVAAAVDALARRTNHWTYVSSLSAYASNDEVGADESAPLSAPAQPGDEYDYSRAKAAAEASVRSALGERAAIVRPGLIVGPGDPTDRFGYWVARFALAGGEDVLAPKLAGLTAQVIDVDDLTQFIVQRGAERWDGTANAIGDPMPLGELLSLAAETSGHSGTTVEADDAWLADHGSSTGWDRAPCRCGSRATCRASPPARMPRTGPRTDACATSATPSSAFWQTNVSAASTASGRRGSRASKNSRSWRS